ncbi:MAG: molybdopterin-dependent oxidoreductase [Chloroflexi bacterium]|nr:molybdopterin-dependent oxidoreductase [Chloroflexota bacterium]
MIDSKTSKIESGESIVVTACSHDCGGACVLKVHVKEGVITRVETDDGEDPQLRACLRGRAYRQRVNAPDRLKFPMKRVGERGEGKFERISWDEALDTVAGQLKRFKDAYGPSSILFFPYSGTIGFLHGSRQVGKLFSAFGGCTQTWGVTSYEGASYASVATYGTLRTGNSRDDLVNSRLIVMWGWNPANTIWVTNTSYYLAKAKESGARIISVDPRFTDTTAAFADQWIPIRPGTDAAMLIAMAYVMVGEKLQDQRFLDTYTVGFDKFKDYVLGKEDGVPKTPQWAEAITGVPADTIASLARYYATSKPAALIAGWGPGRSAMGEQYHRAASVLAAMTGNIGIHGGNAAGGCDMAYPSRLVRLPPDPGNPVVAAAPPRKDVLRLAPNVYPAGLRDFYRHGTNPSSALIHISELYDAILQGKAGGYPADLHMLYAMTSNLLNQFANTNKGVKALKKLESIVVHEQFMTPTARFADILLPINTIMERSDISQPWAGAPYYLYLNKAIDSMHESKTDLEICLELASRLDIHDFDARPEEERLKEIAQALYVPPEYEKFKKEGVSKIKLSEPYIALKNEIEDPARNPFPTPSGKIEIYSQLLADMNNPKIPPVPKYIPSWESYADPLAKKYPLQLITSHLKRRDHSTFDNLPWLRELEQHAVWINSADAQARGIKDGDQVRVFNDRGEMVIPARVSERIMPGVVDVPQGAWYAPDEKGIDRGGCANVLTRDSYSPGGAFCSNTSLVQVEKV